MTADNVKIIIKSCNRHLKYVKIKICFSLYIRFTRNIAFNVAQICFVSLFNLMELD